MKKKWLFCVIALVIVIAGAAALLTRNTQTLPAEAADAAEATTQEAETIPVETQSEPTETTEPVVQETVEEALPRLCLNGDISNMWDKSDERVIAFTYDDGAEKTEGYVKIKIQGNSSLGFEKKNYTIKMYQDQDCTEKLKVDVGWGEENKYCLKANWIDKTHARNIISARIASQIQEKYNVLPDTPNHGLIDGFPIEIYNNDEFLGLYTWNIPKDEWLLNMDGDNPDHIMLCGEHTDDTTQFKASPNFTSWEVEVGEANDETLQKINRLYDFILNSSEEEIVEHIHEYLDVDSALNYYLMVDMAYLRDNEAKNMLLFTYDAKIWHLGLYDMDTSWGTYHDGQKLHYFKEEMPTTIHSRLFFILEKYFGDELVERYFELRKDIFTKDHIMNEFQSFRDMIPEEVFEQEKERWGDNIPGYEYDQIEAYLDYWIPVLDEKYSDWDAWRTNCYSLLIANIEALDVEESAEEEIIKEITAFFFS